MFVDNYEEVRAEAQRKAKTNMTYWAIKGYDKQGLSMDKHTVYVWGSQGAVMEYAAALTLAHAPVAGVPAYYEPMLVVDPDEHVLAESWDVNDLLAEVM